MKRLRLVGVAGFLMIAALIGALWYYQNTKVLKEISEVAYPGDNTLEATTEGFGDPEDIVRYVLYQLQQGNLEFALRGCAVEEIPEYFSYENYLVLSDKFRDVEMIPPTDYLENGYMDIAKARMAADYLKLLEQCADSMMIGHEFVCYDVKEDVPENPDGKYYMQKNAICEVLGSREVSEVIAYISVDDQPKELHFSAAKYKKKWKMIGFSTLDRYEEQSLDIRDCPANVIADMDVDSLEDMVGVILPVNCYIVSDATGNDSWNMLYDFCVYLQRGDARSAMSYFNVYDSVEGSELNLDAVLRQGEAAEQLQTYYYGILLYDKENLAWACRHLIDEPDYLVEKVSLSNMIFGNWSLYKIGEEAGKEYWQIGLSYAGGWYVEDVTLVYKDGWKIESISKNNF